MSIELGANRFLTCEEARQLYDLSDRASLFASELHTTLEEHGVSRIPMNVSPSSFEDLIANFEECIAENLGTLEQTYHEVDSRNGNDAGYQRRDIKVDPSTGVQIVDGKHLFHFNTHASKRWQAQFRLAPVAIKGFLEAGRDIQTDLVRLARDQYQDLAETHPNIMPAYFPDYAPDLGGYSFMRVLSYDSYNAADASGQVAKPHYDIASSTIQAYSDAPGFWGTTNRHDGSKTFYDQEDGFGHFFMGKGHKKVFGEDAILQPLWHGVDRIIPVGTTRVPSRHAVILFINAPYIDYAHKVQDLLPYIATEQAG